MVRMNGKYAHIKVEQTLYIKCGISCRSVCALCVHIYLYNKYCARTVAISIERES